MSQLKAWSSLHSRSANRLAISLAVDPAPLRLAASELRHYLESVVDQCGTQARPVVAAQTGADVQPAARDRLRLERRWGQRASRSSSRVGWREQEATVFLFLR